MKTKTFIFLIVLAVCAMIGNNNAEADTGTPAGTRITNWARVDFSQGSASNTVRTQVMAIYSAAPVTGGPSNLSVAPGNSTNFSYSITNKSDIPLVFNITLTNFALISGYAGGGWTARLNLNPTSIITGTPGTNYSILTFTTNIPAGASIDFRLYIDTASDSAPPDSWGEVTMNIWTPGYIGDNGTNYGATNYSTLTPRVNLGAAYIALKKTVVVTNTNAIYLASGGIVNIPVPESILTYTNYYDNDGTAKATNLEIRDRIPYHTDFIFDSIVKVPHTGGNITVEYYDGISPIPLPTGGYVAGIAYPVIREIRFVFTGVAVGVGDSDVPPDTYGIADGDAQDDDAGYIVYKVVVHRRK